MILERVARSKVVKLAVFHGVNLFLTVTVIKILIKMEKLSKSCFRMKITNPFFSKIQVM